MTTRGLPEQIGDLPKIGLPATTALTVQGLTQLVDVAAFGRKRLQGLHGVGPKAVAILTEALQERGLGWADGQDAPRSALVDGTRRGTEPRPGEPSADLADTAPDGGGADVATWLPDGFRHPLLVPLVGGVHLRPIRASDVDMDMVAVMGNRDMLWEMFGEAWGWPPEGMTHEADAEDLARHAAEMESQESFNYAVLTDAEDALLGCVYIDPLPTPEGSAPVGPGAEVSWWMVAGAPVEWRHALDEFVPRWIREEWPFQRVEMPFQLG